MVQFCSAFSKTLITPPDLGGVVPPPSVVKNWTPGFWIGPQTSDTDSVWDKVTGIAGTQGVKQRLQADTAGKWKGAQLRYMWPDLERGMGEYGWTENGVPKGMDSVEDKLNQIANLLGRKLIIFIQLKSFGATSHSVPAYMRTGASAADYRDTTDPGYPGAYQYSGTRDGEYYYSPDPGSPNPNDGFVPSIHVTSVKNRLQALLNEFATRFNNNPNLEAVVFSEASIAQPVGSPTNWTPRNTWYNNMTSIYQTSRALLSNIQMCQWINAERSDMEWWVPDILAEGIGLGMPDLAVDTKGFNFNPTNSPGNPPGNIYWINFMGNSAIRMGHWSRPALEGSVMTTSQDGTPLKTYPGQYAYPGLPWERQDIADWALANNITHCVVAHNAGKHAVNTTYMNQYFNVVSDNWIKAPGSTILTNTARPTNW